MTLEIISEKARSNNPQYIIWGGKENMPSKTTDTTETINAACSRKRPINTTLT